MESTTENMNVNTTPAAPQTPAPQPAPVQPTPQPIQPNVYPVYPQNAGIPYGQAAQSMPYGQQPVQPIPAQNANAQTPSVTPAQPAAPAPAPAQVAQQPAVQQAATPVQTVQQQSAPQPAPAQPQQTEQPKVAPAPQVQTPAQPQAPLAEELLVEPTEGESEEEAPKKLILNTQRILDDWRFEKGKVLIFLMKLLKVFVVLFSISLFISGFTILIGANAAISFYEPLKNIPNIENFAPIMLVVATFLTIWVSFANYLTPYFKAFSIAKWLKNNDVSPKEVMKIYLQTRREKELTKYISGRGRINPEKSDLSQAAFILLNENHASIYKKEFVCDLVFWIVISLVKLAFVYFLSGIIGDVALQIKPIIEKTASFDFLSFIPLVANPIFLGIIGGWIIIGIARAITLACIASARRKGQVKWIKAFMKEDMPSEEYYE